MKPWLSCFALVLFGLVAGRVALPQSASEGGDAATKNAIYAAQRQWLEAQATDDSSSLQAVASPQLQMITPMGREGVKALVGAARKLKSSSTYALASENPPTFKVDHGPIKVVGPVAVLSDKVSWFGTGQAAAANTGTYWLTQVWQREGEQWKLLQAHVSPVVSNNGTSAPCEPPSEP